MPAHTVFSKGFFGDAALDYQARAMLGRSTHGASEPGEVLETLDRIHDHASWSQQWSVTATRLQEHAGRLGDGDDRAGAAAAYLRAASYWAAVVDGLAETDDETGLRAAFDQHRDCWDAFVGCSDGAHVRADTPYEGTVLPGYLLRPDASGARRPTMVLVNGSDGALTGLWNEAAAGALQRGLNAYVFDGPGQQSMLFRHSMPFRPDWEAVLTPVLDMLVARPDVDADRLVGYGVSQGGYWLPRSLCFEHRLIAAIADPGVVDVSSSWLEHLGKGMTGLLDRGDRAAFDRDMRLATLIPHLRRTLKFRARPYGAGTDWFDVFCAVRDYRLTPELAARIETPLMITDPQDEQFWPGQSQQLAGMLGDLAHRVEFTAAEGANFHCQPLGRARTDERVFGWLADRLPFAP
jgi:hypothetical protein